MSLDDTQFCAQCEQYAREIDRLKAELEHLSCPICGSDVNGTNWKSKAEKLAFLVMHHVAFKFTDPQGNLTQLITLAQEITK